MYIKYLFFKKIDQMYNFNLITVQDERSCNQNKFENDKLKKKFLIK